MTADQIVTAFCEAFEKGSIDDVMQYVDDDCEYHNIPLEPIRGAAAIRKTLEGFGQLLGSIRFEIRHQVASGDVVMNERVDHFTPPNGAPYGLPVTGVFEVRGGKIVAWRDYFDVGQFQKGTGLEL